MSEHDVSDEPRDERGRWTVGGAGAVGGEDKRVLDVGGDKWNEDTAARLEKEYESQRGALDKLAHEGAGKEVEVSGGSATKWEDLSSDTMQAAQDKFIEDGFSGELDNEIENWHENGGALNDAAHTLADDKHWLHESLTELITDRDQNSEDRIPYSVDDLAKAINIESPDYDGYKDNYKHPDIRFDDSELEHPDNNNLSPDQLSLPGVEAPQPHDALTEAMRTDITDWLSEKFAEKAADNASDATPPDFLEESAKENIGTMWSEMNDGDKYDWAKNNGVIDEDDSGSDTVRMPSKFDPLNDTSGENYRATQSMARYLSLERAKQLIDERLPDVHPEKEGDADSIAQSDFRMWSGWKESSVGADGKMIQVAAHDELGGRLNTKHADLSKEASIEYANDEYASIGGYEGVKAMLRAKWETTQYLLDKADKPMLSAYRGLSMKTDGERIEGVVGTVATAVPYKMLPDMPVVRNGAASFSTDRSVSNKWRDAASRVVIRAEVPRTSVISVPAYGVNVHSEHEIVVLGTAWKAWDAWKTTAPAFNDIAIKPHVAESHESKAARKEKLESVKAANKQEIDSLAAQLKDFA